MRAGLTQRELAERAGKATSVIGIANGDDGHDLGLIRRELRKTPAQRLTDLAHAARALRAMVAAANGA